MKLEFIQARLRKQREMYKALQKRNRARQTENEKIAHDQYEVWKKTGIYEFLRESEKLYKEVDWATSDQFKKQLWRECGMKKFQKLFDAGERLRTAMELEFGKDGVV